MPLCEMIVVPSLPPIDVRPLLTAILIIIAGLLFRSAWRIDREFKLELKKTRLERKKRDSERDRKWEKLQELWGWHIKEMEKAIVSGNMASFGFHKAQSDFIHKECQTHLDIYFGSSRVGMVTKQKSDFGYSVEP